MQSGNLSAAEEQFRQALEIQSENPAAMVGMATVLGSRGAIHDAIALCERAIECDSKFLRAFGILGGLYQRMGKFDEAIECAFKGIELRPELSKPYVEIVRCKRIGESDEGLIAELKRFSRDPKRPQSELFHVHWALGKAYDDLGNYALAIGHFESANVIARNHVPKTYKYDPAAREAETQLLVDTFPAHGFDEPLAGASQSIQPILIVGMVRSGTTLLDSILVRHPQITSAGELRFWESAEGAFLRAPRAMRDGLIESTAGRYLEELDRACPDSRELRIIDKMPNNFRHMGLVHRCFPKAKVIHLRRHPVDTCISIFTTDFGPQPPQYAFDRESIVHAYRQYVRLMDHWREALPKGSFIELEYQDLVQNTTSVIESITEYMGLTPSSAAAPSDIPTGDVITPSRWQARQPIYTRSLERWRRYRPWLGAFEQLLTPEELRS